MSNLCVAQTIFSHFASLGFWEAYWSRTALAVAGSAAVGWEDEFSDTDLLVFVPQEDGGAIDGHYRQAIAAGRVAVMNPEALEHNEFAYALIPGTNAHYMLYAFEAEERQLALYDDVTMWVHSHSIVLHDPSGRYARLRAMTSYPDDVWQAKRRDHYIGMANAGGAATNQLRRGDRGAVMLTLTEAVTQALRLCFLLERKPFPYRKWLLRGAAETEPGRAVLPIIEELLEELRRPEIRRVEAATRSEHRNADLEDCPLYVLWRRVRAELEGWGERPGIGHRESGPGNDRNGRSEP